MKAYILLLVLCLYISASNAIHGIFDKAAFATANPEKYKQEKLLKEKKKMEAEL